MAQPKTKNPLSPVLSANNTPTSADNTNPNSVLYTAYIVEVYPTNFTVGISVNNGGSSGTLQAIMLGGILSNLLGLSFKNFPAIGQKVLVLKNTSINGGLDFVLGCIPDAVSSADFMTSTNHIGLNSNAAYIGVQDQKRADAIMSGSNANNGTYPIDMIEGEGSLSMGSGPGVDFLTNLVRLKGTDLSKIECYVIDDFIRILSQNFEHISAFGDFKIINNNGAVDVIWTGSSYEHEALGDSINKEHATMENNVIETKGADDDETFYAEGRWRFQHYIGKLGGFVHTFITEPETLMESSNSNPTGRGSFHWNSDGSFLLQSIGDIAMEKVVRIPVPLWKCRPEELKETIDKVDAYEQWIPDSGKDKLYEMSYKFKDYGRWLANYYAVAAFQSLGPNYVEVKSEEETKEPVANIGDETAAKSKYQALQEIFGVYLTRYATIRIFRDGSILLLDGYGSSVHMAGRDVSISASKDILLNAAGNINMTASDIHLTAKDAIDVVGVQRGVSIVGRQWIDLKSDGPVLIESDYIPDNDDLNKIKDYKGADTDDSFGANRVTKSAKTGIVLRSPYSNILIDAENRGVIINCLEYLNRSLSTYFTSVKFIIDKVLSANIGNFIVGSSQVLLKNLYANFISNKTASKVTVTDQDGLTKKHDDDKVEDEKGEMVVKTVIAEESDNKEFKAFSDDSKNPAGDFFFEFRKQTDALTPAYSNIYQSASQQWLFDHKDGDGSEETIFKSNDYGELLPWVSLNGFTTLSGSPVYPPKNATQQIYISRLGSLINEPTSKQGSNLSPSTLQGAFTTLPPSNIFHNPKDY